MLDLFTPYLGFISLFLTIVINVFLLLKNAPWWSYIIANLIIPIILLGIGFSSGDLFNFLEEIFGSFIELFKGMFEGLFRPSSSTSSSAT